MTAVEILKAGRELLSDPARCTKGAYARDIDGGEVGPLSERASCWCSHGALSKATGLCVSETPRAGRDYLSIAFAGMVDPSTLKNHVITVGHDDSDHPTILRAWDRAKQSLAILAMLQAGPCTTRELMDGSGSLRVGARIKDIRDYGYLITTEMHMGGRSIYRLVRE